MELALLQHAPVSVSENESQFPALVCELLEGVLRGLASEHSRRAYRSALTHFLLWSAAESGRSLTRLTVLQYKDMLVGEMEVVADGGAKRRFAPATVNQRLAAIRAFAQEAADRGLLALHEVAGIRRIRGEKGYASRIGMWLGTAELERVLLGPDRGTVRGQRDYALLAVLFSTGLRRSELADLSVSHFQQRDGQWGLIDICGKGGKVRSVPLPLWVKDALVIWLKTTGIVQGSIFRSISRHGKLGQVAISDESVKLILLQYAGKVDLGSFRPHDARRTCARQIRAAGAGLEDIKELLGHASIQTTERYLGKTEAFVRGITNAIKEPRR